eukprot:m.166363 g.166363  ORF g.166363 m.166363 type:complete len:1602 (+) comp16436_c27_seq1:218-5023(+)
MSLSDYCGGRNFWGPSGRAEDHHLDPNWDESLDFSTCFEDTVLTAIPTLFLLLVGSIRLWILMKKPSYPVPRSLLHRAKMWLSFLLVLTVLGEMCVALYERTFDFRVVSPAVQIIGYVFAIILLTFERRRNVLSSSVLTVFWLLTLIVDAVRMRTLILQGKHGVLNDWLLGFFSAHVFFDVVSFFLACMKDIFSPEASIEDENPCPEQFSTFFSFISFWWMTPMMMTGYKRALRGEDLFNLMPEDQAQSLARRFHVAFQKQVRRGKDKASLVMALAEAFGGVFAIAAIFKALQDVLTFVQPQLLNELINFVTDSTAPTWHGYALAGGIFGASVLQSICLHQYFHRVMKTGMRLRSAVVTAVYTKSLALSTSARQSTTSGEIVNLMAVDAQRFMDLTSYLHMIWSAPFQISLALYFLWQLLGVSTLAGLGVMVLMIPLNGVIAKKSRNLQKKQMKQKDDRVKLMNEILNGIKVLKLYAWESAFGGFVKEIRSKEVDVLKSASYLSAVASFSWSAAPFFVSLVTFLTYTLTGHSLTAQKAFVALALFNLLRFPLTMLPFMISGLVEASVSVKRLRTFLLHDEKDPNSVIRDPEALRNAPFVDRDGTVLPAFFAHHGTFAWKDNIPILHDITFQVLPMSCTAVVGRVGAGKSSLISALHGDMQRISGTVVMPGSVAYVPQQAWIRNATLRENILFGKPYDEVKYKHVLFACALEDDLKQLPGGDETEIGEKGINLSGGQKQRVSLARAVYQDADIYILDDCLSAVDSHVGKHIFRHVIGPKGCLATKARLLVTHALHVLPHCDNIIMMRQGRIHEQGTFQALMSKGEDFARLIEEFSAEAENSRESAQDSEQSSPATSQSATRGHSPPLATSRAQPTEGATTTTTTPASRPSVTAPDDEEDDNDGTDKMPVEVAVSVKTDETATAPVIIKHTSDLYSINEVEDMDDSENAPLLGKPEKSTHKFIKGFTKKNGATFDNKFSKSVEATEEQLAKKKFAAESTQQLSRLIDREQAQEGKVAWHVYKNYLSAVGYLVVFGLIADNIITFGLQIGSNFWLSYWSTEDERHLNNANYTEPLSTGGFLGVYAALGLGNAFGTLTISLLLAYGSIRASRIYHTNMLDRVLRSPMSFFDTTPMGRILNRFSKDIYVIDETIPSSLRSFLSTFMQVISIVVVISISTPIFMAAVLPMGVLYYYIQKFYVPTSRQLNRLESVSRSPIYAHFSETLAGVSSIRAYQREQEFIDENEVKVNANLQAYYPSVCANRWLAIRLEFLGNCITFFAALFAVVERNTVTGGVVGLSLSYAMSITQTLNWMVRMSSQLETDIVAVERVEEYCSVANERPAIMMKRPEPSWPDAGAIVFDKYSVRYRETLDLVLRSISASVRPGEKIGIVGRTGAGKSSLSLALFRLLEAAEGSISIDGHNIASFGLDDLRSRLTIMPQDPVLFSGTVRRNLDPLSLHSDNELWRALETCHLKDLISELDGKLEHEVAEGGENFSVGQRQLICLARAVLRKTKVLVLDEATAAVDLETDELIQRTIRSEFKTCTILTIAHRLNTILDSDRIIVLDAGQIKEFDTPQALMANEKSIFAGMARAAGITSLPSSSDC